MLVIHPPPPQKRPLAPLGHVAACPSLERLALCRYVVQHPIFSAVGNVQVTTRANLVTYPGTTMVANTLHATAILLGGRRLGLVHEPQPLRLPYRHPRLRFHDVFHWVLRPWRQWYGGCLTAAGNPMETAAALFRVDSAALSLAGRDGWPNANLSGDQQINIKFEFIYDFKFDVQL
ncbi:hypothetical protein Taro_005485 [Colocasia esculenta]|uniref:Uncharacterized protein n=1 Tax=Colocasia esculenta TaxID=4460 RepID=A0A843TN99_COLES|nr:hypothetical protein [Colocasia esculenta]